MYVYISAFALFQTFPLAIPVYFTQTPTSCPTNQDLSLLLVVTDATRARAPVYPTYRSIIFAAYRALCTCMYKYPFTFE